MSLVIMAPLVLALAACGSSPAPTTPGNLFHAYLQSTNVKNDEFTGSATSADRMANFAAHGTPSDIEGIVFSAYPCDTAPGSGAIGGFTGQLGCPPAAVVTAAAANFTGSGGMLHERNILVQHQGGQLELMPVYVATNSAGATELIDTNGTIYTGGLADFRQHNQLLTADDQVLAPADITATSGGGKLVVVTGQPTGPNPWLILGVGLAALVVFAGVLVLIIVWRTRRWNRA
jgi:hypothetical protein